MKKALMFLALLLSGCQSHILSEPTLFGMSESQFKQLTPEQQRQVIASYHRQQEIRTKNEPLESLIGVLDQNIKRRDSRTTVQIHNQTIDQPIRECHVEGTKRICSESLETTHKNNTNFGWDFRKS